MRMKRRQFIQGSAIASLAPQLLTADMSWSDGRILHLIPTVSQSRIQLKVIFTEPVLAPKLLLAGREVPGFATDTAGTGNVWPSNARGTPPLSAGHLKLESPAPIEEKNGFTLVDITEDEVRIRLFKWRREFNEPSEIDQLTPYHDVRVKRGTTS